MPSARAPSRTVLFLCPHNAGKSVIAAAYLDRLASQRGLDLRADSAGTEPEPQVSAAVVAALREEGIDVSGYKPRLVTAAELAEAWKVVSLGCDLSALPGEARAIERWDDVPSPREDLARARHMIALRLAALVEGLGDGQTSGATGAGNREDQEGAERAVETAKLPGAEPHGVGLWPLIAYFFKLGALGFGGPIALAGYMQRDLAEERGWITRDEYQDGLAIAQTMPGPLAAQLAMWIGFIRHGVLGATLVGIAFVLAPFVIVVAVAAAYVRFEGLPQIRALFYGIGPAAIAIIALAAWKLARSTDGRDPKLWLTSLVVMGITVWARAELAWLFVLAGLLAILVYAPPWRRATRAQPATMPGWFPLWLGQGAALAVPAATAGSLVILTLFFLKAAAFTFGSGLAIVPFLHQGVVVDHQWLGEREFLDAVAMGIITPGPVVIMATFVGYLAAGMTGAVLASLGVFAPVWVFNVVIGRLFLRHRNNPQVRGFVKGATAAAVGAIAGASVILAEGAMVAHPGPAGWAVPWGAAIPLGAGALLDPWTVAIFLVALAVLYYRRLKEPYVVGVAGVVGLVLFG